MKSNHHHPFFPSQLNFFIKGHKHSGFSTSCSFTHCKSWFCYHRVHSSTLTKNSNEPLAANGMETSVLMSLNLASQVPAHLILLPLCLPFFFFFLFSCLPFLKCFTDFSSKISVFSVHILYVTVLMFPLSYSTFSLHFHTSSGHQIQLADCSILNLNLHCIYQTFTSQ